MERGGNFTVQVEQGLRIRVLLHATIIRFLVAALLCHQLYATLSLSIIIEEVYITVYYTAESMQLKFHPLVPLPMFALKNHLFFTQHVIPSKIDVEDRVITFIDLVQKDW